MTKSIQSTVYALMEFCILIGWLQVRYSLLPWRIFRQKGEDLADKGEDFGEKNYFFMEKKNIIKKKKKIFKKIFFLKKIFFNYNFIIQ